MSRMFLIVLAAGLVVVVLAALLLAAFPPTPVERHVEQIVPNSQIKGQ
jgi:hypothetical protein